MALNKPAWQSSVVRQGFAGHAVDGNRSTDTGALSCSATLTQSSPWWIVDLQSEYEIFRIVITLGEGGSITNNSLNFQTVKVVAFGVLSTCFLNCTFHKVFCSQGTRTKSSLLLFETSLIPVKNLIPGTTID